MASRLASAAFILALAAPFGAAAQSDAAAAVDIEKMTPAQLRKLQVQLDRQGTAKRGENAALSQRIAALEEQNATLGAKKAEVEARLADVLERLARLEEAAARKD